MFEVVVTDLFPTKFSFFIFIAYIALFVSQGLLVTASQEKNNSYAYDVSVAVLLTECIKFAISLVLYSYEHPPCTSILKAAKKHIKVLWLYFIPAALYCFYNNLSYINLKTFDPTTYFILLQLRVVFTGIIFQIVFKKGLTKKQWLSLIILTLGCMAKKLHSVGEPSTSQNKQLEITFSFSTLLIFVQILCSCIAGVFNEYLLKFPGGNVNMYLQNTFMYFDSILCNILFILFTDNISDVLRPETLLTFMNWKVIFVVLNNAVLGIVTSFFLKSLNSIIKNFASALELVFTAFLSQIFFSIPIHTNTAISIILIIIATIVYSQSPVKNQGPAESVSSTKSSLAV